MEQRSPKFINEPHQKSKWNAFEKMLARGNRLQLYTIIEVMTVCSISKRELWYKNYQINLRNFDGYKETCLAFVWNHKTYEGRLYWGHYRVTCQFMCDMKNLLKRVTLTERVQHGFKPAFKRQQGSTCYSSSATSISNISCQILILSGVISKIP